MLTHLHIRNLAIIDEIEIDLHQGLTVLTGETGAGKSILIDALQLAVGGRAGVDVIRHGAERAEVAASFELAAVPAGLRNQLEEQSIEFDAELVLRRVVTREGKSRSYLNGQPVPLQILREVGSQLVEIHGQMEFQTLARAASQRELLDGFGGLEAAAAEVARLHREASAARARRDALEAAAADRDARLDLLRFQHRELEGLALKVGETRALHEERSRLGHREKLAAAARSALDLGYESEVNAHALLSRAASPLRSAANIDAQLEPVAAELQAAAALIAGAAQELNRYLESLEIDPHRQEVVEQRLAAIEAAARKHRVPADELPARAATLQSDLQALERASENLGEQNAQLAAQAVAWRRAANTLTAARKPAAARLGELVSARMQRLGMAGGRFEVTLTPRALEGAQDTTANGLDDIEFRFSANPGQPPMPVGRVASGGELSRLSLAVQVTLAVEATNPGGAGPSRAFGTRTCMVFDEVDAGVGGGVAEIVGRELAAVGARGQALCVTHLPQVAAQGAHHLRVSKLTDGRSTRTQVRPLGTEERVEEVARMLGGVSVTDKAREHAAEMLNPATPTETRPALVGRKPASGGRNRR